MEIKTKDGVSKPMPLSDIQLNNRILLAILVLGWAWFLLTVIMIWYLKHNNVVNNFVAACL